MIVGLLASAWAADLAESNISATTVGVQYWQSTAQRNLVDTKTSDLDVLLQQRLRWTIAQKEGQWALRARVMGSFTLSPGEENFFKRNRVRQLGVSLLTPKFTVDLGRHPVFRGGPRLVDGLQFRFHASDVLDIGVWGGLLPDLFSTDPRFKPPRFGGGPIVALTLSRIQASIAGEVAIGGGGLDRAAVLVQARASAARTIEVSARADLEIIGAHGFRISDAQAFARWSPLPALRIDASYNLFSSFSYQNTQDLDPDLSRFAQRYQQVDPRFPDITQDCFEPNMAHMAGGQVQFHPRTEGIAPLVQVDGRYRFGPDVDVAQGGCVLDDVNNYVRIHPAAGVTGLPVGYRLDVTLDGNYYAIEGRSQMDAGLSLYWEPIDTGVLAVDTSYRLLLNGYDGIKNPFGYQPYQKPGEGGIGHYGDFFVDVIVPPLDTSVGLGLNVVSEPGDVAEDLGIGGFARVTKYLRKRKSKK